MHVMLFEAGRGGHAFTYVRLLLPALLEACDRVTLVTRVEAPQSEDFHAQLGPLLERVDVKPTVTLRSTPLAGAIDRARALRAAMAAHRPGHVLTTTLDGLAQGMGLARVSGRLGALRSAPIEGAVHNCRFAYPARGWADRLRAPWNRMLLAAAPVERCHMVDLVAYEDVQRRGGALAQRCVMLPDPVEAPPAVDRDDARRRLDLPREGRLLVCPGALSRRKGVDLLIGAFARAALHKDDRLLLAGRFDADVRRAYEQAPGDARSRIVAMDRYLTNEEFDLSLAAADVVCAPYPSHAGISNIALRAAKAGRPVLASDFGWLGRITPRFDLGWTCPVHDDEAFAGALARALHDASAFTHSEATRRLLAFHTVENFRARFTARLMERVGRPPLQTPVDWAWVVGS